MPAFVRNPRDLGAGILFLAIGAAALLLGRDQPLGTVGRMGPGYFPTVLGALLAAVGLAVALRALIRPGPGWPALAGRPLALVTASTALFALLLRGAGLVAACLALVIVSALASRKFSWGRSLLLGALVAVFSSLVFVRALGLPIPIFGTWVGGG